MWQVEVRHHHKAYRNGDLEDTLELLETKNFKTRTAGKEWIESKLSGKPKRSVTRYPHKGDTPSNFYFFTGVSWQHENSGEQMDEYYQYTLKKAKIS